MQDQLPSLTYDVIFNKESSRFEVWQYNNDFNTRALLQSYSLEYILQLLKENFVNALLLLGGTMKQVPEVENVDFLMDQILEQEKELMDELAKDDGPPAPPDDIVPAKKSV